MEKKPKPQKKRTVVTLKGRNVINYEQQSLLGKMSFSQINQCLRPSDSIPIWTLHYLCLSAKGHPVT